MLALGLQRRRMARRAPTETLRRFHSAGLPSVAADWRTVEFTVLDFETTGTDPAREDIVSAGWVLVLGGEVRLASAVGRLVRPGKSMPEGSAVIHAITDDEAARGEPLADVLEDLLGALEGRVLVAHFAAAELGFLDAACRRCQGGGVRLPCVDTMQLGSRALRRAGRELRPGDLRLDALRASQALPPHDAHDALGDAVATAELFLAQAEQLADDRRLALGDLLCWSGGG
jgi:DNA polymerase-3 subunit epsilon